MEKERYEWIQSWTEETNDNKYKRVLLIGDSIFRGSYEMIKEELREKYYVDFISSSYTVDRPIYRTIMQTFENEYEYDLVLVNQALHGKYMDSDTYTNSMEDFLSTLKCKNIVLVHGAIVYEAGLGKIDAEWDEAINSRNDSMDEISERMEIGVIPFYDFTRTIAMVDRAEDGFHYKENGCMAIAKYISGKIDDLLK